MFALTAMVAHPISGMLHLKVGRGPKEITVRSTEYSCVIVYNGIYRVSSFSISNQHSGYQAWHRGCVQQDASLAILRW